MSHVHRAYDYLGPFVVSGYIWLDTKIVFKKTSYSIVSYILQQLTSHYDTNTFRPKKMQHLLNQPASVVVVVVDSGVFVDPKIPIHYLCI